MDAGPRVTDAGPPRARRICYRPGGRIRYGPGGMLWQIRNMFSGSYLRFTEASRR